MNIKILHTSNLKANTSVLHPFIKVHIVSLKTGTYLLKNDFRNFHSIKKNSVYQTENYTSITHIQGSKQRIENKTLETIPPFATNTCDLRTIGKSSTEWNEDILINADLEKLVDNDILLLFELLDYSPYLLLENPDALNRNNYLPIAWGYLRLSGLSQCHIGYTKVQLYENIFDTKKYDKTSTALNRSFDVPDVYFDFLWPKKIKYEGFLAIDISAVECPTRIATFLKDPMNVFEEEEMGDYNMLKNRTMGESTQMIKEVREEKDKNKQIKLNKMLRYGNEASIIPNEPLQKFKTDRLGCNTLSFSPNGRFLAAAVTLSTSRTWIHIYDVEDQQILCKLQGHKNIIHDFSWTLESEYLLSSSSDMSCKV